MIALTSVVRITVDAVSAEAAEVQLYKALRCSPVIRTVKVEFVEATNTREERQRKYNRQVKSPYRAAGISARFPTGPRRKHGV